MFKFLIIAIAPFSFLQEIIGVRVSPTDEHENQGTSVCSSFEVAAGKNYWHILVKLSTLNFFYLIFLNKTNVGSCAAEIEDAQLVTYAPGALIPPAKRRRVTDQAGESDWSFSIGRKVSSIGIKRIHLKDPKGGSYTRNGKETTWRCSSKARCSAVVRKVKGDTDYKLYNKHSCPTKSHGPLDVTPIPIHIQQHLSDSHEMLVRFVNEMGFTESN